MMMWLVLMLRFDAVLMLLFDAVLVLLLNAVVDLLDVMYPVVERVGRHSRGLDRQTIKTSLET